MARAIPFPAGGWTPDDDREVGVAWNSDPTDGPKWVSPESSRSALLLSMSTLRMHTCANLCTSLYVHVAYVRLHVCDVGQAYGSCMSVCLSVWLAGWLAVRPSVCLYLYVFVHARHMCVCVRVRACMCVCIIANTIITIYLLPIRLCIHLVLHRRWFIDHYVKDST